jgi:hypothetical protein
MTYWIKVSDELPPVRTVVLAYAKEYGNDNYDIIMAVYYDRFEMKGRNPNTNFMNIVIVAVANAKK